MKYSLTIEIFVISFIFKLFFIKIYQNKEFSILNIYLKIIRVSLYQDTFLNFWVDTFSGTNINQYFFQNIGFKY